MKFLVFLTTTISLTGLFFKTVPSYAQVFKCLQGGVVSYSDKACAKHKFYVERDTEYDRRTKHGTNQDTRAM